MAPGQLDPYDPRTTKGWRYIHATDALKVLLPPGTAAMYEQLLKFEAFELAKKSGPSQERILQIRHLKDRMVRKCIKLAKSSPPPGTSTSYTIVAPPDFRLKEMEKWFKEQQKRTNALLHPQPAHCPQCIASRRSNHTPPEPSDVTPPTAKPKTPPKVAIAPPSRRSVSSPPPLPHLLRIPNLATGFDLSIDPQRTLSLPQTPPPPRPQLTRRRSCIKRSSTGDFTKTVSWADDRGLTEHLSKYASLARQAQLSGRKLEDIRDIYLDQMNGLEALHQQVEQCMEHLRSESDHLKRADETIRRQREILRTTFEDFEKKQLHFQAQVQGALDDADHVLSLTSPNLNEDAPP